MRRVRFPVLGDPMEIRKAEKVECQFPAPAKESVALVWSSQLNIRSYC